MLVEASWISKGVASNIPDDGAKRLSGAGASGFPTSGVIVFPLEGAGFSQEKWLLQYGVISKHWKLSSHFPMPLPQPSHFTFLTTADHAALPVPKPKVSG